MGKGPDKEQIRRDFPECVGVADAFRDAFGPDVKILYMNENGREIGRRSEKGNGITPGAMVLAPPTKKKPAPAEPSRARWEEKWEE